MRGGEVARVITNLTFGPDGCGGQAIYVRWEGAGQEEAPIDWAGKVKEPQRYQLGTVALCEIH